MARLTFRKVVLGFCTLVLALQLIGAAAHDHDMADVMPDCVSCHMGGHFIADVPAAPAAVLAILLAVAYVLTLRPRLPAVVVLRYLIPPRQAPPRR